MGSTYDPVVDAFTLERAAQIIAGRSTKPDSVATRALIKVLRKQAGVIRREAAGGTAENELWVGASDPAAARRVAKQPKVPPPSMVPVRRASRARRPGH
jgi:hypothetical protein